jgi:hypothetical protein
LAVPQYSADSITVVKKREEVYNQQQKVVEDQPLDWIKDAATHFE